MNDKDKSTKKILNCTLSTSEGNEHTDSNCIIKKVEIKICKETNEGDLVNDHRNNKVIRTGIKHVNANIEGRLQFFKDGKFIFELARSRKGDKCGWIPVPKNIFESSSIRCKNNDRPKYSNEIELTQSFSGQCSKKWKQQNPQKIKCKNPEFFFKRTKNFILSSDGEKLSFKKRRQPLNKILCDRPFKKIGTEKEKKWVGKGKYEKKNISIVVQKLIDQIVIAPKFNGAINLTYGNINNYSYMKLKDFQYRQNVSPRKRILKELEKVTLDDATKRSRAKEITLQTNDISVDQINSTQSSNVDRTPCKTSNGANEQYNISYSSNTSKLYSSYSINSLLGNCKNKINYDNISEIQKSSSKPELTISNIMSKKMVVKPNDSLKKDSLDNIGTASIEKNVDFIKTCLKSDEDVSSPLNYSKYFNIDSVSTNLQSCIANQHLYQSFPTFFSSPSPPQFSSLQANNLQTLSAFSSVSKVSQEKCSQKVLKVDKFSTCLEDSTSKFKKYNLPTEIHNGSGVNQDDSKSQTINLQRTNNAIIPPSMFRMYSHNGTPSISNTFYMPHLSYYHPYATSAMRHQLWMHYQSEIPNNSADRLSPALFCLNGFNSYSSIGSVHELPIEHFEKRIPSVQDTSDTPISLCVKDSKEECSSDVPLNLSKH